jgi:hypothetical protein
MWELLQAMPPRDVARIMGIKASQVHVALQFWKKKGYLVPHFRKTSSAPRSRLVVLQADQDRFLRELAQQRKTTPSALLTQLVAVVVKDNLVKAILE